MAIFHFTSTGTNVKYVIKYAVRAGMEIGSSGLVMTDDFPTGTFATREFSLVNPSEANIELFLVVTYLSEYSLIHIIQLYSHVSTSPKPTVEM